MKLSDKPIKGIGFATGGARPGAGRKPIAESVKIITARVPADIFEQIPEPRAAWVRDLIIKALVEKE